MITIRDIEISRFRSIREAKLNDLEHFSILAGLNNSGKSNVLRALSLFFTGHPEPGVQFDFARTYYRGEWSAKKKKVIGISVHFTLSPAFKFRPELAPVEQLLQRDFTIKKEWGYRQIEPAIYLNGSIAPLGADDVEKVNQFLSLISFRYIPNRVNPTEIIRREQQALRDVLVRRLARYKIQSEAVFQGLQTTAETLVKAVSSDVTKFAPDIKKVRLATANSLADLVFQFGYQLEEGGVEMDESEQGSGMQSLLMFETLHLIDRDYFQQFGWKQAAIWAVEEPESSLNAALEAKTAHLLHKISKEKEGRLQIIGTTHSDLMIQYAEQGYFIEKQSGSGRNQSTITAKKTRELLTLTSRHGVSRWVNPILYYPLDAVVLVEGKYDRDFLLECLRLMAIQNPPRVVCLADIKQDATQGGDARLHGFVKEHVDVIRARNAYAKVAVLLDWDSANKRQSFENLFHASDPFKCLAWDSADANPKLADTFRGIERFFPDRIIQKVEAANPSLFFTNGNNVKTINPSETSRVKPLLNAEVASGLTAGDEIHAHKLVQRLITAIS